jgi:metal-responsive CopG/Arc/MetJ family transcriptional regulator
MPQGSIADRVRAYRRRQVEAGNKEVTLHLPSDAVNYLDDLKERHGLQNRSQALLQLIERGRQVTQQQMT